jgi:hypothetical protein
MRESPGELRRKIREFYDDRKFLYQLSLAKFPESKSKTILIDGFWNGRQWERSDVIDDLEAVFPWLKE